MTEDCLSFFRRQNGRTCRICEAGEYGHEDALLAQLAPGEAEVLRPILEGKSVRVPRTKRAAEGAGPEASAPGTADVVPMETAFHSVCSVKEADPLLVDRHERQVLGGSGLPREEDACSAQEMVWLEEE